MRERMLSSTRLRNHKLSSYPCPQNRAAPQRLVAAPHATVATLSFTAAEQQLREWIHTHGGHVHPHLGVADPAPCGVRGIVAVQPILLEDLEKGPVISIPAHLHLTCSVAIDILQQAAAAAGTATGSTVDIAAWAEQQQLSHMQLIGAALALERSKGSSSMWTPYLQMLPDQPPCPWMLADAKVIDSGLEQVLLQAPSHSSMAATTISGTSSSSSSSSSANRGSSGTHHGGSTEQQPSQQAAWAATITQQRDAMAAAAHQVCQLLAPCIQLVPGKVVWGMGQVASRSLGTRGGSGLVPYVDLLNHHPSARPPMLTLDDADQLAVTVVPIMEGEAVPLAPGQELYISYAGGFTPLEAYMKFGFVSPEWWHEHA